MKEMVDRYKKAVKIHNLNIKRLKESSIEAKRTVHASEEKESIAFPKQLQSPTMLKYTEPNISSEDKPILKIMLILQNTDLGKSIMFSRPQTQKVQGVYQKHSLRGH